MRRILPTTCSRPPPAATIAIGPVLLGAGQPVHILTPSATVHRIVNMTALTVADAERGAVSRAPGILRLRPVGPCAARLLRDSG